MTPETCKQLLANGVLQGFAEGRTVIGRLGGPIDEPSFSGSPEDYKLAPVEFFVNEYDDGSFGELRKTKEEALKRWSARRTRRRTLKLTVEAIEEVK